MRDKRILLIEDDDDSRTVYSTVLRHSGFDVLEAVDGGEGIRLAQEHRPDLIVMDLGLPNIDGWAATDRLKQDPETAAIPVVAITVHIQDFYRGRAIAVGCDAFLEKPCSPSHLISEIDRLLN